MTNSVVKNLKTPIGDILKRAAGHGVLLDTGNHKQFALIPLDDDLIDYLLERNPKFIRECRQIDAEMRRGKYKTHAQVKKMFAKDLRNARPGK